MEVWNVVFSQFDNDGHGHYSDLIQQNIDTGMGLERLAVAVQDVDSIFDVDTLRSLREEVCDMAGKKYHDSDKDDVSIRVVTDHIRSATFMVSDGIMPSNTGRGYVLRRIIRRACRHGRLLGIEGAFLTKLAENVIDGSKDGYPELDEKRSFIINVISEEEEKFDKTINQGLEILDDMIASLGECKKLSGEDAFKLFDTFGFPVDLTKEILEEKGYTLDEEGYEKAAKEHKEKAKGSWKKTNYMGAASTVYEDLDAALNTEFIGYDSLTADEEIAALCLLHPEGDEEDSVATAISEGQHGAIITKKTPFYGTMGGQVGDTGVIETKDGSFTVTESIHVAGSKIAHVGVVTKGMIKVGDIATLKVDASGRTATCRNHSATHLMQKALREVLGSHVEQKGSYQDPDKTRFDF